MVLLIVDTQTLITTTELYNFKVFEQNLKTLISRARKNNIKVIYIRHDDGEGAELTKGTPGYEIYDSFRPIEGEVIFDKNVNSSFHGTGLLEYLREKNENVVMVAGLQTDYCMDATIKCGFEHGLRMIVPADTNTTFDNEYMSAEQTYHYYNDSMWKGRYAECISFKAALEMMEQYRVDIMQ